MPKFYLRESVIKNQKQLEFVDFVQITKGMSISSLASGDNFLELGLSKIYNLRLQVGKDGDITASLISTLNSGEMPPVRIELISDDERVTAELLERRIHALRQVYAMSLLLGDDREKELYNRLLENPHADLEAELVSTEDKLLIQEAGPGSLILTVIAKSKRTYQAVLNACALPYAEGRNALLRRVQADTALKELSVEDKSLDIKLKKAHGIVDVLKKIDSIKDKDERDEIRRSFIGNLSDFSKPGSPLTIKAETQSQPAIPAEQPAKRPARITKATPARSSARPEFPTSSPAPDTQADRSPLGAIKKET